MLYRKYRAQNFAELVGQEAIVKILRQAIAQDTPAHAYLFTGPRGTGKTSSARILAKALNCLKPKNGEPCNKCANCEAINEARFLDLIEIDAASNRGIDEIRELKEKIGFLPVEGKYKVYIIDEVHMLTNEAFNALLKTLEEPPTRVIFILATTEPHKLPLTIISRTQRFDFKLANKEELATKLTRIIKAEGYEFKPEALALLVTAGQGSYRDAETILEKVLSSLKKQNGKVVEAGEIETILGYVSSNLVADFMAGLLQNNRKRALEILNIIETTGLNLNQFTKQILESARFELLQNNSQNLRQIINIVRDFNAANLELKYAPIPILVLELAVFNLTSETEVKSNPVSQVVNIKKDNISATEKVVTKTPEIAPEQTVETNAPKTQMEEALIEDSGELLSASDFDKVFKGWGKFLLEAKKYNHYLVAVLTQVSLDKSDDGYLIFRVPLIFHQKRLQDKITLETLKKMAVEIYGCPLKFKVIIDKDSKTQTVLNSNPESNSNEKVIEDLFGAV